MTNESEPQPLEPIVPPRRIAGATAVPPKRGRPVVIWQRPEQAAAPRKAPPVHFPADDDL